MGLYKKMHDVMCESEGIEKNLTVGSGGNSYRAVGESSVLNAIKPLLKKHGLILFPVEAKIDENFQEFEGKYGKSQRYLSTLHAKYKIVDVETGEFEILETVGYGVDSQDKGSGKAMTYAYKSLIQKTFVLFSGEDTDNEHSDDISKRNSVGQQGNKPQLIDKTKANTIVKKAGNRLSGVLKHYKVAKVEDMTLAQWTAAMKQLEKSEAKNA